MSLFAELEAAEQEAGWGDTGSPTAGESTLDRVHQSMVLFAAGRGEALKRFLVLARGGGASSSWKGVSSLLGRACVTEVPEAATAVFVGTEFDSLAGRGGDDGTPVRKTPWGEIAWQLLGADGVGLVAEHERTATAPGGDVISKMLPADRPVLILLGEHRLEAAITTDIAGKDHAHAVRLDGEATPDVRKARLHRKVATSIFFESNGGQQKGEATLPEVRLAVAEPDLDIGSVEQSLEALADACYYLGAQKNRYRFSFQPNLNKLLADRRASVPANAIRERARAEIQKVFGAGKGVDRIYFPEKSAQVPDRSVLTLVVVAPESEAAEPTTRAHLEALTREHGSSSRTYKSALIWCVAEDVATLNEEARRLLAWEDIDAESPALRLDEAQRRQLEENLGRSKRDLREAVWRTYKNVFLLDEKNALRKVDLGLVHSSAADSLVGLVLARLRQEDLVVDGVSPNFLSRNWPPALPSGAPRRSATRSSRRPGSRDSSTWTPSSRRSRAASRAGFSPTRARPTTAATIPSSFGRPWHRTGRAFRAASSPRPREPAHPPPRLLPRAGRRSPGAWWARRPPA